MSTGVRRLAGVLFALAALAGATWAQGALAARTLTTARDDARAQAKVAQKATHDALYAVELEALKARAAAAAQVQQLRSILGTPDAVKTTLRDGFKNEPWWQDVRDDFPVYHLVLGDERLTFTEGMDEGALADDLLVARTKTGPEAEVVMGKGWPYLAAAAPVAAVQPGGQHGILVLARPLDERALAIVARRTNAALLITNHRDTTFTAGPEAETKRLRELMASGDTTDADVAISPDVAWAAARETVAAGITLWTHADTSRLVTEAMRGVRTTRLVLWGTAGLVALFALVFALRGGGGTSGTLSQELADTRAELERLRTGQMTSAPGPAGPQALGMAATMATGAPAPTAPAISPASAVAPSATGLGVAPLARTEALDAGRDANVFGRYRLVDRLGEGGMAEVYTAVTFGAEGFRRTFVVKRLRAELARDPEVVGQFIDEAKLASTLVHSNIVPVFDFGKVGDEYFLAQEYILGRDLTKMVTRSVERGAHALPVRLALYAAHEVLRALEYAHTRLSEGGRPLGIVHRDVSPSNILVSARGEVKLFDFGIVKAEGRVTKTQHGIVKGNVSFMSPEQARGIEVDARADLFSLGLVIYFTLTGRPLYEGQTTYELLVKAATGPGEAETAKIRALPDPVPRILLRALAADPAARYQNAAEFAAALAPHAAGGGAELAKLVASLFSDDFRNEETRFAASLPVTNPGPAAGARVTRGGS